MNLFTGFWDRLIDVVSSLILAFVISIIPTSAPVQQMYFGFEWKMYESSSFDFSFQYPQGWSLTRNTESEYQDNDYLNVTLGMGDRIFDMQVSRRNPSGSSVQELLKSFGSSRVYTHYGVVDSVESVESGSPESPTINFTKGDLFFNIDTEGMSKVELRGIFDTFRIDVEATDAQRYTTGETPPSVSESAKEAVSTTTSTMPVMTPDDGALYDMEIE